MGSWPGLVWWRLSPVAWDGMGPGEGKLKGMLSRSPALEGKQLVLQKKSSL